MTAEFASPYGRGRREAPGEGRAPLHHRLHAWDALPLAALEWDRGSQRLPLLCLPGIVRTGWDFEGMAKACGHGCRVIAVDYPGRGDSGRARRIARYRPEACLRDILDVCAALHLHRVIAIGTSFGGLLAMGIAMLRPTLIAAAILNDIGPEIGQSGSGFVRKFVGHDPAFTSLEECIAFLKTNLPPLSFQTDDEWRRMTSHTYAPAEDGRWHPVWDTRIAQLLDEPTPDLWPLFHALDPYPVLLTRGLVSDILLPQTVERMRQRRPDMPIVEVPDIGHAPTLEEPQCVAAISAFLEQVR
jgi:pimeloyl-ACP methyl ester carboxylesterase